ncbi:hypothetical protein 2209_scaffold2350_00080 [Bacteriophage sp.]|nr:hypothetical protein 2209_scaffold2350_00080 [Bacteriophage sp.]
MFWVIFRGIPVYSPVSNGGVSPWSLPLPVGLMPK